MNCMDYLVNPSDILQTRAKEFTLRLLDRGGEVGVRSSRRLDWLRLVDHRVGRIERQGSLLRFDLRHIDARGSLIVSQDARPRQVRQQKRAGRQDSQRDSAQCIASNASIQRKPAARRVADVLDRVANLKPVETPALTATPPEL